MRRLRAGEIALIFPSQRTQQPTNAYATGSDSVSTLSDPCNYLQEARAIAYAAGSRILEVYERPFRVSKKEDGSPLTEADHAAHDLIVERLRSLTPAVPVLSEESVAVSHAQRDSWERFWLVDPLDGTKEFVKRNGEFTVNIALIDRRVPVLGVVLAPALKVAYWACIGAGAFKQAGQSPAEPISARCYEGGTPTVAVSRSHAGPRLAGFLASVARALGSPATITMGSALKMCLVADGTADVYPRFGPTSEWDTAAAQCIVQVAGGRLIDLENRPLSYNKPSLLNPWFLACGSGCYDWIGHARE